MLLFRAFSACVCSLPAFRCCLTHPHQCLIFPLRLSSWTDVFRTIAPQRRALSCRKDYKEDKEARSPQNSLGGDEELPFFGQTRPRSQSHPPTGGVSGLSFTSQRPTLLPTITRSSTGGSASLQSPRPNRTLLFIGVAAACLSMLACLYMLFSRPVHSAPGDLAEPTEPNTIDKVTIRAWTANTTASATLDETAPRVALCFFGLSRSLKFTLASIEDNILRPLRESGYRPTVFLHTYKDAVSADEQSKQTQADEWKLLNPFQSVVTSQEEFLQTHRCVAHVFQTHIAVFISLQSHGCCEFACASCAPQCVTQ